MRKHTNHWRCCVAGLIGAALSFSSSCRAEEAWRDSELPAATIEKVQAQAQGFNRCLDAKVLEMKSPPKDSRKTADEVLRACEPTLQPVQKTFDEAKIDRRLSERYLRMKRNQAARNLMRVLMAAEAQGR